MGGIVRGGVEADVVEAGVAEAGVVEADVVEAGVLEAGVVEAGVVEAGVAEAGVVEARVAEAVVAEAGVVWATSRRSQMEYYEREGPISTHQTDGAVPKISAHYRHAGRHNCAYYLLLAFVFFEMLSQ